MRKNAIRIRTYRAADCSLVSIPMAEGFQHILFDSSERRVPAVVRQIFEETAGKLALLIATSGHDDFRKKFDVQEEWAPGLEKLKLAGLKGLAVQVKGAPAGNALRAAAGGGPIDPDKPLVPFGRRWKVTSDATEYYAAIDERDKNLLAVAATGAEGLTVATRLAAELSFGGQTVQLPFVPKRAKKGALFTDNYLPIA